MRPIKRLSTAFGLLVLVGAVLAAAASGTPMASTAGKPVIGKPVAVPAKAMPGQRFTVTYKVTNATGAKMVCNPTVAGKLVAHTDSLRAGVARLSLIVPAIASGKVLSVRLAVTASGGSATKVSTFPIATLPKPSISIQGVTAPEGNASTTLSFPVTLSASSLLPVSVSYATTAGTATAGTDFTAATGTLAFKPGERTKTITVTVVGDTVYEPDETFTVALSNPVNATIATASATGTIQNDDPVAQPGHYAGQTSQNEAWAFDVTPDGKGLTNLTTGQINMSCSIGGTTVGSTYGGNIHLTSTIPIASNGSFSATVNFNGTISGIQTTSDVFTVAGQFTNNTASGTWNEKLSFTYQGYGIDCTTGDQTWTATRTG
jgi:hypothetical protein